MAERCTQCGHSYAVHNDLGYCSVRGRIKGECPCDDSTRSAAMVAASPYSQEAK